LERVREDVRVHERAPRLSGAERAELAPRVPQTGRGLAGVHAGSEQLELERRLEIAERCRRRRLGAETALANAREGVVVVAELILHRWQLAHPQGVEPGGIDLLEVVPHVEHREAV